MLCKNCLCHFERRRRNIGLSNCNVISRIWKILFWINFVSSLPNSATIDTWFSNMVSNSSWSVESRLNTNCNIQTPSIGRELKPHGDIHGQTPIRSTDRHSCRQNERTRRVTVWSAARFVAWHFRFVNFSQDYTVTLIIYPSTNLWISCPSNNASSLNRAMHPCIIID